MKPGFEVAFLPDAIEFLESLNDKAREKIFYNIKKAQFINDSDLFKKLNDFIWEFRTLYNGKAYRLFSFWDETDGGGALIIATHGILKKSQKKPPKGIKKADKIRTQYFDNKRKAK